MSKDNNGGHGPDRNVDEWDERDSLNPAAGSDTLQHVIVACNGRGKDNGDNNTSEKGTSKSGRNGSRVPPDGGLYAWLVCLAALWTNGSIFGVINSEGVLHVRLLEVYGEGADSSSFKISLVGSLSLGTTFLLSPVAAILTESFGIRQTAFVGSILVVAGMFLSSFVTSLEMLYVTYGIMLGVGASLAYTPSLVILGHYFKRRLGFVNGVATAGSSVFTMVLVFIMKALLDSVQLSGTFLFLSGMSILLLPCALLFKPIFQTRGSRAGKPAKSGSSTPSDDMNDNMASSNSRRTPDRRSGCRKICDKYINTSIWNNRKYLVWAMAFPVALFGYFMPYVHLINHVKIILPGYSGEALLTCMSAASMVGRLVFGRLADLRGIGRIQLQQISFFSLGVLTMLISVADEFWMLVIICIALGIFDGCFISLLGPIAFEIVGEEGAPQAIGFLLGICSVPLTLGPPIGGWIYDRSNKRYELAFLVAGIPPIVGAVFMFAINRVRQSEYTNGVTAVINGDSKLTSSLDETSKLTHSVTKEISEEHPDENSVWKLQKDNCRSIEKNSNGVIAAPEVPIDTDIALPAVISEDISSEVGLNNEKNASAEIAERESAF